MTNCRMLAAINTPVGGLMTFIDYRPAEGILSSAENFLCQFGPHSITIEAFSGEVWEFNWSSLTAEEAQQVVDYQDSESC